MPRTQSLAEALPAIRPSQFKDMFQLKKGPNFEALSDNSHLLEKAKQLYGYYIKFSNHSILKLWEFGKMLSDLDDVHKYGPDALERLSEALGIRIETMRYLKRFSEAYTQDEVRDIIEMAKKKNMAISWTHFLHTLPYEPPQRKELIIKAIEQNLTSEQMRKLVQKVSSKSLPSAKRRPKAGRPVKKPDNFSQSMHRLQKLLDEVNSNMSNIWDTDDYSLSAYLEDMPDEAIRANFDDYEETLMNLLQSIRSCIRHLDNVQNDITSCLSRVRSIGSMSLREN
jgi:hypothetical protein